MHKKLFLPILLIVLFACKNQPLPKHEFTLIKGGTIIGLTENQPDIENGYILFRNNKIIKSGELSEHIDIPPNTRVIDTKGKYIVPGLIDGFAVMNNQFYANAFLNYGITTIIGVDGGRRGWFYPTPNPGPDFYMLESVGDEIKSDSAHLADLYRLNKNAYKIILLKYKLTPRQVSLIHNEAKKLGLGTIGELGYTSYKKGAEIGVDAFVHTTRYMLDVAPEEMQRAVADHPFSNDLNSAKWKYYQYLYKLDTSDSKLHKHAGNMAQSETFLMPTISLLYGDLPDSRNLWEEPVAKILNPADINNPLDISSGKHNYTAEEQKNYTAVGLQELKIESIMQKAGAKYLAGSATDVWGTMPGISLHTELELLNRIGLSNREAIAAATCNFAEAFDWKAGKLEAGYEADILILNENPLENLNNLKDIHLLINNGSEIDRNKLLEITYDKNLPDGSIISRKKIDPLSDTTARKLVFNDGQRLPEFRYLDEIIMEEIYYMSDGFRVKGYMAYPKINEQYPAIIYNRGGNREFSKISNKRMIDVLARMASWGYVVVGSQYRGNDGGDGQEEFGGADVNDVINLIPLLESMPQVNKEKLGIYGRSRGGMMTYLSLMRTNRFSAAVVVGGVTDLQLMNDSRGGIMEKYVYSQLIPNYWKNSDSLLKLRSAITQVDKICKTTPILIMHGTADWRVLPDESYNIAQMFQKEKIPYRLLMFEGADHGLTEHINEANEMMRSWFDRYLKKGENLPDLEQHGN